jgi:hypothetical protein
MAVKDAKRREGGGNCSRRHAAGFTVSTLNERGKASLKESHQQSCLQLKHACHVKPLLSDMPREEHGAGNCNTTLCSTNKIQQTSGNDIRQLRMP